MNRHRDGLRGDNNRSSGLVSFRGLPAVGTPAPSVDDPPRPSRLLRRPGIILGDFLLSTLLLSFLLLRHQPAAQLLQKQQTVHQIVSSTQHINAASFLSPPKSWTARIVNGTCCNVPLSIQKGAAGPSRENVQQT